MTKNPDLSHLPRLPDVDTSKMVEGSCEYCRKRFWIDPVECQVLHEIPFCAEFQLMDALDFVRANNKIKLERRPRA